MSTALEQLKTTLSSLPASERTELAQYLLRSFDPEDVGDVKGEWLALAERRMADVRAGKVAGVPADEVLRSLPGAGQ